MLKFNNKGGVTRTGEKDKPSAELKAAALRYEAGQDRAPHVVAAGSGCVAQKILQVAIENGVAIYHDDSAATMLAKLEAGREIPPELYQIVVNIYVSLLDTAAGRQKAESQWGVRPGAGEEEEEETFAEPEQDR